MKGGGGQNHDCSHQGCGVGVETGVGFCRSRPFLAGVGVRSGVGGILPTLVSGPESRGNTRQQTMILEEPLCTLSKDIEKRRLVDCR